MSEHNLSNKSSRKENRKLLIGVNIRFQYFASHQFQPKMRSTFDFAEYVAFALSLLISVAIGLYFGCVKGKSNTVSMYLLGGKQLTLLPVAMSLVTAYVSGISLLGIPSEVYLYGTQCQAAAFVYLLIGTFSAYVVIPVFYKLQLFSSYDYMEMRFGQGVRMVLSASFTAYTVMYIPQVLHGATMALTQVTAVDETWITLIISSSCIFYTTLGGLKAVVWTDTVQGVLMIISTIVILVVATTRAGGVTQVLSSASARGRLEIFNFDPDPTLRLTFWSSVFGMSLQRGLDVAFTPESVQRFTSLPTLRDAQKASILLVSGLFFFGTVGMLNGILITAEFSSCDPLTSGLIERADQILPFYVVKVCGDIRGLPGLFLAGIVCAALSSMSASLNTLSGTFYRDFVSRMFKEKPSDTTALFIIKSLVVIFGTIGTLGAFSVRSFGNLTMIIARTAGLTVGPAIGMFLLGLLFPWATNKGAVCGGLTSLFCTAWLTVANAIYKLDGHFVYPTKPFSVDGCLHNFTAVALPQASDDSEVPYIYRTTVYYNIPVGIIITVVIGLLVSYLTGPNRLEDLNPDLFSPVIHGFFPQRKNPEYTQVPSGPDNKTTNTNRAKPEEELCSGHNRVNGHHLVRRVSKSGTITQLQWLETVLNYSPLSSLPVRSVKNEIDLRLS
ncbi:hypothetical protein GE061_009390 [Apolygus lucorum]|uniref:Sodium-dependent multivitamin transporter n=1 Tax=Apolygus lucorum TaxID=248454 RepID=A0A8S9Y0D4_APOLU|nr:hypothetical protein GE061_009390 [Apolygus lucorum]